MVLLGPGAGDPAVPHGADGALGPDGGVGMDEDGDDHQRRGGRVRHRRPARHR